MNLRRLDDIDLNGKRALIRVDVNVPTENGHVRDLSRLERMCPTILEVLKRGGKPILLSHFGRPQRGFDLSLSTQQTVSALAKVLKHRVHFASSCIGDVAKQAVDTLPDGDVLLLENTRFHAGEKKNDPAFARALADLGDCFIADTFSTAHRAHASVIGIAAYLPSVAGCLMQQEITALENALRLPKRPVMALVGGAKVSSKLLLLKNLIKIMGIIVIGGGMANTFLAAQGKAVGQSLCEHDLQDTAQQILADAQALGCEIILPRDIVISTEFRAFAPHRTVFADACPADHMILDLGKETTSYIHNKLEQVKTVVWNGPLGAFELAPFDGATSSIAQKVGALTRAGALQSIAGGGDTIAALNAANVTDQFSYISTGGGAFLEWLEGKTLPGVAILQKTGGAHG